MAKTTIIIDDIDGTPEAQEVQFSYAGTAYTIDLAETNRAALEDALKPYIEAASQVGNGRPQRSRATGSGGTAKTSSRSAKSSTSTSTSTSGRSTRGRKSPVGGVDLAAVRAWAGDNGYQVSSRGRVSKSVMGAYESALREQSAS